VVKGDVYWMSEAIKTNKKILKIMFIILISREILKILMCMLQTSNAQGN